MALGVTGTQAILLWLTFGGSLAGRPSFVQEDLALQASPRGSFQEISRHISLLQQPKRRSLLEVQMGRACALYPALEKKFGKRFAIAGFVTVGCLGRGEQGEAWQIEGAEAVLKVLYRGDEASAKTSAHACKFARLMHKRDAEHFVDCLGTGAYDLDLMASDPVLDGTYTQGLDCNLCAGSRLKSETVAGKNDGKAYTCLAAQQWATTYAAIQSGCPALQDMFQAKCCAANGDFLYEPPMVSLHYSVDGLASGDELMDLMTPERSDTFPRLRDAFQILREVIEIAGRMLTPSEEDPTEFYYYDLHLGNVKMGKDRKIKFIDYGSTYMCCNHEYPGAADKCAGELPECDRPSQAKYRILTSNFLFIDLLTILGGGALWTTQAWEEDKAEVSDIKDYFGLPWALDGLLGPPRKDAEDIAPAMTVARRFPLVKQSYLAEWQGLGDVATYLIYAGLKETLSKVPGWPTPMAYFLELAIDRLK